MEENNDNNDDEYDLVKCFAKNQELSKSIKETTKVLNQIVRENANEIEEGDPPEAHGDENNTNEQNAEETSEKESRNDENETLDNLYNIENNTNQQIEEDQTENDITSMACKIRTLGLVLCLFDQFPCS